MVGAILRTDRNLIFAWRSCILSRCLCPLLRLSPPLYVFALFSSSICRQGFLLRTEATASTPIAVSFVTLRTASFSISRNAKSAGVGSRVCWNRPMSCGCGFEKQAAVLWLAAPDCSRGLSCKFHCARHSQSVRTDSDSTGNSYTSFLLVSAVIKAVTEPGSRQCGQRTTIENNDQSWS
jgi:hypothetical protein